MAANPVAAAPVELAPCETCGRKFNPTALERHAKVTVSPTISARPTHQIPTLWPARHSIILAQPPFKVFKS